jgi:hypothetical protein
VIEPFARSRAVTEGGAFLVDTFEGDPSRPPLVVVALGGSLDEGSPVAAVGPLEPGAVVCGLYERAEARVRPIGQDGLAIQCVSLGIDSARCRLGIGVAAVLGLRAFAEEWKAWGHSPQGRAARRGGLPTRVDIFAL